MASPLKAAQSRRPKGSAPAATSGQPSFDGNLAEVVPAVRVATLDGQADRGLLSPRVEQRNPQAIRPRHQFLRDVQTSVIDCIAGKPLPHLNRQADHRAALRGTQLEGEPVFTIHRRYARVQPPHVNRNHAVAPNLLWVLKSSQDEPVAHFLLEFLKLLLPLGRNPR